MYSAEFKLKLRTDCVHFGEGGRLASMAGNKPKGKRKTPIYCNFSMCAMFPRREEKNNGNICYDFDLLLFYSCWRPKKTSSVMSN